MLQAISARRLCLSISNGQVKEGAIIYLPFTELLLDMRPNARKQTSPTSGPVQGCKWVFLTPFGWVRKSQHGEVERLLKVTHLAVAKQGRESGCVGVCARALPTAYSCLSSRDSADTRKEPFAP